MRESFIAKSSRPSQVAFSTKHLLQVKMKLIANGPWLDKLYITSRNHRSKTDVEKVWTILQSCLRPFLTLKLLVTQITYPHESLNDFQHCLEYTDL